MSWRCVSWLPRSTSSTVGHSSGDVWLLVPYRVRQQHGNQSNVVTFLQVLFRAWCEIVIIQIIWKQLSTEGAPVIKVCLGCTGRQLIDNDLQALEIEVVGNSDVSPCTVEAAARCHRAYNAE